MSLGQGCTYRDGETWWILDISKIAPIGFADGLGMWWDKERSESKVIKEEHVLGQAVWYALERVQVHRHSGIKLSYTPALLTCVTLGKLLSIFEPGSCHLWKLTELL